jgi:hypothetical protein
MWEIQNKSNAFIDIDVEEIDKKYWTLKENQ